MSISDPISPLSPVQPPRALNKYKTGRRPSREEEERRRRERDDDPARRDPDSPAHIDEYA